mmetsp:Transcript_4380/g.9709  ORF Transcript_4380/g.9709 Transcript_4380/m.9709 type:complete len:467 (+) Transcript_4380:131-1531(+)
MNIKSLKLKKKEQSPPPAPTKAEAEAEAATAATSSKPRKVQVEPQISPNETSVSTGTGSKFSFRGGKSKKESSAKKQQQQVVNDDGHDDEVDDHYITKSSTSKSSSSSSCCSCKRLVLSSICFILLAVAGIVTWRYGPWAKNSVSVESLVAESSACDNCCNGLESNCNLPVNKVLFPMVHNAHSSYDNNFMGASNNKPFEEALVAGYRALQFSTCLCKGFLSKALLERDAEWGLGESNLGFCHMSCGMGVRDPKDVLTNLKEFIETNPREVLIIEFDMLDGSSADLRTALQRSGLIDYVYHPQDEYYIAEWPTMEQLIDDNTRVLLFGNGDGMDSCPAKDCTDGILYANDHFGRTATDGSDLDSCESTISGDVSIGYFVMNHYQNSKLKMPSKKKARELNSYSNLEVRMERCQGQREPNLLAVHFWDEGEVLGFVSVVNSGRNREGGEYGAAPEDEDDADEEGTRG